MARQLSRVGLHVNTPFYALLIGKVTTFALNKLSDELARSRRDDFPRVCTGTFTRSMGLPCAHTLRQLHAEGNQIPLSAIHRHWVYLPDSRPVVDQVIRQQLLWNPLQSSGNAEGRSKSYLVVSPFYLTVKNMQDKAMSRGVLRDLQRSHLKRLHLRMTTLLGLTPMQWKRQCWLRVHVHIEVLFYKLLSLMLYAYFSLAIPAPLAPDQVSLLDPLSTGDRHSNPSRSTRRDPSEFETIGTRVRRRRAREGAGSST